MFRPILLLISTLLLVGCRSNSPARFIKSVSCYADYSTVEWSELCDKYDKPDISTWSESIDMQIIDDFPESIACQYWYILQKARTDFHQKSLPLRDYIGESDIKTLDNTEAMFDTVFVRCVTQEYYMRLLPEVYNEVMKPAIDKLTGELTRNTY